jgi:hypothetical protein
MHAGGIIVICFEKLGIGCKCDSRGLVIVVFGRPGRRDLPAGSFLPDVSVGGVFADQ